MPESFTDTPLLTERYDAAMAYALQHHRRQLRKGTEIPYTSHLLSVSALVLEMGGSEDEAIGALLHDLVEDGGGPAALVQIEQRFGPAVAHIVEANTDTDEEPKPPWRERKEAYVASIRTKDAAALRVSLADKLHNARAILRDYRAVGEDLWERFKTDSGPDVRWYYRALLDAFEERRSDLGPGGAAALDDLRRALDELDAVSPGQQARAL